MELHGDVARVMQFGELAKNVGIDRKSTRLNSSHSQISYAVFCLKKKKNVHITAPRPTLHSVLYIFTNTSQTIQHNRPHITFAPTTALPPPYIYTLTKPLHITAA